MNSHQQRSVEITRRNAVMDLEIEELQVKLRREAASFQRRADTRRDVEPDSDDFEAPPVSVSLR